MRHATLAGCELCSREDWPLFQGGLAGSQGTCLQFKKETPRPGRKLLGQTRGQRLWHPGFAHFTSSPVAELVGLFLSFSPASHPPRPSVLGSVPSPSCSPHHTLCRINFLPGLTVPSPDFLPEAKGHSLGSRELGKAAFSSGGTKAAQGQLGAEELSLEGGDPGLWLENQEAPRERELWTPCTPVPKIQEKPPTCTLRCLRHSGHGQPPQLLGRKGEDKREEGH